MAGIDLPTERDMEIKYLIEIAMWKNEGRTFRRTGDISSSNSLEAATEYLDSLEQNRLIWSPVNTPEWRTCITTSKGDATYARISSLYKNIMQGLI